MPYIDKLKKKEHNKDYYRNHREESHERVRKFRNSPDYNGNRPKESSNRPRNTVTDLNKDVAVPVTDRVRIPVRNQEELTIEPDYD